ncbi:alpha-tubulin suppressor-like RCC1 family protein [Leucobacter komagatae]|uniref:Alpha-tubulin suppressor-like RCC1 family protein n=1 Tax=Leucobacter komagatae TaxID=55969 RepID=A0A542Y5N6_9MICO|nr:RCC1 domain-containing protein [Leucobacter komagatae]TQL43402.1 alpha-tubulin suppressor-like RCC1 family protein [Leucobacter komagatae]
MRQHTDRGAHTQRTVAKRVGMGLAACAALVVAALGVTSTMVGAVSTDSSTVHNSRFAKSLRIDAGVYNLEATPETGDAFGPGAASGVVSFATQAAAEEPLSLGVGDQIDTVVALPAGVRPVDLPAPEAGDGFTRAWTSAEAEGRHTVRATTTITHDRPVSLPAASFAIESEIAAVVPEEALTIRSTTETSDGLTSLHPDDSAIMPMAWNVKTGVYGLDVTGTSPATMQVQASTHPESSGEDLYLRRGDAVATTFTLPSGVTPGQLPESTTDNGFETVWSSSSTGGVSTVTVAQTATAPRTTLEQQLHSIPVEVSSDAWLEGYTVAASIALPERFLSNQVRSEAQIPGRLLGQAPQRIAAGGGHSTALGADGETAFGWGANRFGQAGTGSSAAVESAVTPLDMRGATPFKQVSAGADHTLALGFDGHIYGWGSDEQGKTGIDKFSQHYKSPLPAVPYRGVTYTQVSAGAQHSLALDTDGRIWGWGSGAEGATGSRAEPNGYLAPSLLEQPKGLKFVSVEAGSQSTYAIDTEGRVWVMGTNRQGQLGLGQSVRKTNTLTQLPMPGDARIVQIAANSSSNAQQTLALTDTGEIIAWGLNEAGEAGLALDGSTSSIYWEPKKIQQPEGVRFVKLAAGEGRSMGLSTRGQVYSWGAQALGYEAPAQSSLPLLVPLPAIPGGYTDIAAGQIHSFALGANNELYGWGWQTDGRLGNAKQGLQATPILIELDAAAKTASTLAEEPTPGEEPVLDDGADAAGDISDTEGNEEPSADETSPGVETPDAPAAEATESSHKPLGRTPGVAGRESPSE